MSGNLYHWRKKKAWNPYCLRSFVTPWLKGKGHHSNVGRTTRTESARLLWHLCVHTTQGGLKTLTLKRVKVTVSSRFLLNVPKHLAAVPELNCVYVCTGKVQTCLKTMLATFLEWQGDGGYGSCHSRWQGFSLRLGHPVMSGPLPPSFCLCLRPCHTWCGNSWGPQHKHWVPNTELQPSIFNLLTGNPQGTLFFYMCPLGPQA